MFKIKFDTYLPIYYQIKEEIKYLIACGILKPNQALPSIRQLATELIVNPNTVARAYRELEEEGIIYSLKGKGCYVANKPDWFKKEKSKILDNMLDEVIIEAQKLEFDLEKLKQLFNERINLFKSRINRSKDESHSKD
ncbi:MAG: GntR family transcriptional regulator [Candidatus Aminicenantia bacterium]